LPYQLLVDHGVTHSYNGYCPPVAVRRHRIDLDHLGTQLRHGRHSSLNQSEPELLESWNVHNKSIIFVDDGIIENGSSLLLILGNEPNYLFYPLMRLASTRNSDLTAC
jgi:hypothetical protein